MRRDRLAAEHESVALGAAIWGAWRRVRGDGYASMAEAIRAMARIREDVMYRAGCGGA
jgi:hypothetical protein